MTPATQEAAASARPAGGPARPSPERGALAMPEPTIMVWDIELELAREVPESEARAGMLRYAQTLGAGTACRAVVEDFAINGDLCAPPPANPAWRRPS